MRIQACPEAKPKLVEPKLDCKKQIWKEYISLYLYWTLTCDVKKLLIIIH